jgi:hypothetical protein
MFRQPGRMADRGRHFRSPVICSRWRRSKMARDPLAFQAFEVCVDADVRHRPENLRETASAGPAQRGFQDFPMFGFRASPWAPALSSSARTSSPSTPRTRRLAISRLHPFGEIVDIMCPAACRD